jgi:uncharacterized protein (TIGR02145 family)
VNLSGTGNDKVATPTFNPSPGNYTSAQNVTISCTTLGATIHYTTNGADPIESDPVLNGGGSVAMSSTTTLKARGYKNGWVPSDITSGIYSIYPNTVMDIDGNIYHTVTIGSQVWMAENLKVTHYRNGDPIPNVTVDADWGHLATGKYCNYNNDFNNAAVYGSLYNWYSVNDSRNIAPAGWHVPSDAELQTLIDYLGGSDVAGGKMKETGTTHWQSPNTGATNESDFSAMPCGYRYYTGSYNGIGEYAFYWSSSMYAKLGGLGLELEYNNSAGTRLTDDERHGFSIRCIKD